jgi:LytS/YehU family sensor histidine kinase
MHRNQWVGMDSLNKGNNILSITDELSMLADYIRLNEISYNKKYSLEIQVEDSLVHCYTFKHILQPIVENSILHAFSGVSEPIIRIRGYFKENDIILQVIDNGCKSRINSLGIYPFTTFTSLPRNATPTSRMSLIPKSSSSLL